MASKAVVPRKINPKFQKTHESCLRLLARDTKPCTHWNDKDYASWKGQIKALTVIIHTEDIDALDTAIKLYLPEMAMINQRADALNLFLTSKRVNKSVAARIVSSEMADIERKFLVDGLKGLVGDVKKDPKLFESRRFYLVTKFRVFVNDTRKVLTHKRLLDKIGAKGSLSDLDILAIEDKTADIEVEA